MTDQRRIGSNVPTDRKLRQGQAAQAGKPVELWVLKPNPAVSLYRRLGFLVIGEDPRRLRMLWRPRVETA
jgi:hypothetical protein